MDSPVCATSDLCLLATITQGNCPLLVTELAHTQHRASVTALYNSNWFVEPVDLFRTSSASAS